MAPGSLKDQSMAEVRASPANASAPNSQADHLCVLVHGLYGHPEHLSYICNALKERHGADKLQILSVRRNCGNLTYDGIELGGERVALEIEEYLKVLKENGCTIRKLSIVGYSLGGLISRYAIGLLFAKGYFEPGHIQPVNFTTFATPHVGVRSPARRSHFWNVIGARTVSISGRQLFMIDNFRNTGKPLLSVLATPGTVFMIGLARFQHRSLYANIVNDKAATFYTCGISKTDPFNARSKYDINYTKGYEPVVVDHEKYFKDACSKSTLPEALPPSLKRATNAVIHFCRKVPFYLYLAIFVPLGSLVFLVNAGFQTIFSLKRIHTHEQLKLSSMFGSYDVPLIVEQMRGAAGGMYDEMYESVNAAQSPEYLDCGEQAPSREVSPAEPLTKPEETISSATKASDNAVASKDRTLALTPAQFEIIDNLNNLGFRKFPVYIHKHSHSHAAIIVRMPKPAFEEGEVVIKHWLDNEFHVS